MLTEKEIRIAQKKVKSKRGFYNHFVSFIIVNGFLAIVNNLTTPNYFWVIWPLLSWGVGLAFHYVNVFGVPGYGVLDDEWEERELNKEISKIANKKGMSTPIKDTDDHLELKEIKKVYKDTDFV